MAPVIAVITFNDDISQITMERTNNTTLYLTSFCARNLKAKMQTKGVENGGGVGGKGWNQTVGIRWLEGWEKRFQLGLMFYFTLAFTLLNAEASRCFSSVGPFFFVIFILHFTCNAKYKDSCVWSYFHIMSLLRVLSTYIMFPIA